tara:strand:- start:61 stop:246 length:186 start_codon:yes stop_codon:yes gene_type:complete
MDQKITFVVRSNYGQNHLYVTSEHAEWVSQLTGKITINSYDIAALEALGFTVEQVPELIPV